MDGEQKKMDVFDGIEIGEARGIKIGEARERERTRAIIEQLRAENAELRKNAARAETVSNK